MGAVSLTATVKGSEAGLVSMTGRKKIIMVVIIYNNIEKSLQQSSNMHKGSSKE